MDLEKYLTYPARFILDPHSQGFSVFVRNDGFSKHCFAEFSTCGDDFDDAMFKARDVVITMAEGLIQDRQRVPGADKFQRNDHRIEIPYLVALKIMLSNLMLDLEVSVDTLAAKIGISPKKLVDFLNPRKKTSFDDLAQAFKALGKPLKISY